MQISIEGLDEAFAKPSRMLVTFGVRDALLLPRMSERVLDLNSNARLSIYPEAGHAPFYEQSRRFNAELAAFVSG
jgi:non-heme chloroperoxidase